MSNYIPKDVIEKARKIDLLTYFKRYNPTELVKVCEGTYKGKTHDSLIISNGLWYRFSTNDGGKSAIDYLIKVEGLTLQEAVKKVLKEEIIDINNVPIKVNKGNKKIVIPKKSGTNKNIIEYLINRGIDEEIINYCIKKELIYQEEKTNNVVFIGYDNEHKIRYAGCRSTNEKRIIRDAKGSSKEFSFRILSETKNDSIHIFESAIDLLSYATLLKIKGYNWRIQNLIALAGVYQSSRKIENSKVPIAVEKYLINNPNIEHIVIHFDNDIAGRNATKALIIALNNRYNIYDIPAPYGKDINDYLCYILGLKNRNKIEEYKKYLVQKNVLVCDLFKFWLENEIKTRCTYNTYYSYRGAINNHIIPKIGNITLSLLNTAHIQNLYEQVAENSYSTFRNVKIVVESGLKYALNKQLISYNPAIGIKVSKKLSVKNREYKPKKEKTLTEEQLKLLIQKCKGTSIYLQVLFSGLMGLRVSEVNGLKFSDVDFINKKLKVQRQLGIVANSNKKDYKVNTYSKQEIPVKTLSSNRELDIPDIVFDAILEQRKIYEKNKHRRLNDKTNPFQDLGYICCSSYGRPRSKSYNFPHFKKILKENNIPNIRWHDLRATYATLLMKNKFSLKAISKRMGHAKLIITADVYGDKKEIIRDCTDNLSTFLNDVLPCNNNYNINDLTEKCININNFLNNTIDELTKKDIKIVNAINDTSNYIINEFLNELVL